LGSRIDCSGQSDATKVDISALCDDGAINPSVSGLFEPPQLRGCNAAASDGELARFLARYLVWKTCGPFPRNIKFSLSQIHPYRNWQFLAVSDLVLAGSLWFNMVRLDRM
jgi:hypothetical protein